MNTKVTLSPKGSDLNEGERTSGMSVGWCICFQHKTPVGMAVAAGGVHDSSKPVAPQKLKPVSQDSVSSLQLGCWAEVKRIKQSLRVCTKQNLTFL